MLTRSIYLLLSLPGDGLIVEAKGKLIDPGDLLPGVLNLQGEFISGTVSTPTGVLEKKSEEFFAPKGESGMSWRLFDFFPQGDCNELR